MLASTQYSPEPFEAVALFVDVRGSSRLTVELGEARMREYLGAFQDQIYRIVKAHHGRVLAFNGDGTLAAFRSARRADDAVAAAVDMQRQSAQGIPLAARRAVDAAPDRWETGVRFGLRIGMDVGKIYERTVGFDDAVGSLWIGRCTNTAAKLAEIERFAGTAVITSAVLDEISPQCVAPQKLWSHEEKLRLGGELRCVYGLESAFFSTLEEA